MSDKLIAKVDELLAKIDKPKKPKQPKEPKSTLVGENTQTFINEFFHKNNLKICEKTFRVVKIERLGNQNFISPHEVDVRGELLCFIDNSSPAKRATIFSNVSQIEQLIDFTRNKIKASAFHSMKLSFNRFEPDIEDNLEKLIDIIFPPSEEDLSSEDLGDFRFKRMQVFYVIRNFYQQIKLRMQRQRHDFPIIPTFFGRDGTGKTKLAKKMIEIFDPFVAEPFLGHLLDVTRSYQFFKSNFVLLCDDISSLKKHDESLFKNIVTSEFLFPRRFHSQETMKTENNATFLFTSNEPSWCIIKDPLSNRRLFDIEIKHDLDLDMLEAIDFSKLMLGIKLDVSKEEKQQNRMMIEQFIKPQQASVRNEDYIDEFIRVLNIRVDPDKKQNQEIGFTRLFAYFKAFCTRQEYKQSIRDKEFKNKFLQKLNTTEHRTKHSRNTGIVKIDMQSFSPEIINDLLDFSVPRLVPAFEQKIT